MPSTVRFHRVLERRPSASTARFSIPTRWPSGCRRTGSPGRSISPTPASAGRTRCRSPTSPRGKSHSFGGKYLELVPHERLRYTDKFDDPNLPGEMTVTVTLKKVSVGTEIKHRAGGDPRRHPGGGVYLGWQESLTLLALLVEAEIRRLRPCFSASREGGGRIERSRPRGPQPRS